MRHKERIDVKNIKEKEIVKVVSIGQKDVRFRLQNAYVGQVGENTELLDETLVDNMLELMAKAVKTNYSKYNPVPNEIIIRNTMSEKKEDKPADNKESQDMIESYEPRFLLDRNEYQKATPYLTCALQFVPDDIETLEALKICYEKLDIGYRVAILDEILSVLA